MFIMQFFIGLAMLLVGVYFNLKTESMLNNWGRIQWFEDNFGVDGGSRLGYKVIGLIAIFIGILLMTGLFNDFASWVLEPLTRYAQPQAVTPAPQ